MTIRALLLSVAILFFIAPFASAQSNPSAAATARRQVDMANGELARAREALRQVEAKLRSDLEQAEDWKTAQAALVEAQKAYDAVATPVLEKVRASDTYQAALVAKEQATAQFDKLRANPKADAKKLAEASDKVIKNAMIVVNAEANALAANPAVVNAKAALVSAEQAVAALRASHNETVQMDANWKAAQARVDTAQQQANAAREAAASASKAEAQASAERARAAAAERKANRPARSGGGSFGGGGY